MHFAPHLTSAIHLWEFDLVPSVGIVETLYGEAQDRVDGLNHVVGTNIVRSARDFSLDLVFPNLQRVFNKKTIFGDKLKHVIEPRAVYRYVTGIGTDFNRFIRFDERDLLSDTNEVLLSITNRVYAKRGDTVQEILTWDVMQKRYFDPTFGGALLTGVAERLRAPLPISRLTPSWSARGAVRRSSRSCARIRSAASACNGRRSTIRASAPSWTATSRWTIAGKNTS